MTLDEFLAHVRTVHARTPFGLDGTRIRTTDGFCPVCAVGQMLGRNLHLRDQPGLCGWAIGLRRDLAEDLGVAADRPLPGLSDAGLEINGLRR